MKNLNFIIIITFLLFFSKVSLFAAPPLPPNLLSPSNNATTVNIDVDLSWSEPSGATHYIMQIASDPSFNNIVLNASGLPEPPFDLGTVDVIDYYTTYYWRIKAANDDGLSDWSAVFNFTTKKFLTKPVLVSPANNSEVRVLRPTFNWNSVLYADTYDFQVAIDDYFFIILEEKIGVNSPTYTLWSDLADDLSVYWRVKAKAGSGEVSVWSDVYYTTVDLLQSPSLSSPADNAILEELRPTLNWQSDPDTESYNIQIATNSNFSNLVFNTNVATNQYNPTIDLTNFTQYWWRVQTKDGDYTSEWSTSRTFTVEIITSPTLLSPDDLALDVTLPVDLTWQAVQGATSYFLEISTENQFLSPIISTDIGNVTTYSASTLSNLTQYFWRIKTIRNDNESDWSSRSFTTGAAPVPESWDFVTTGTQSTITLPLSIDPQINGRDFVNGDAIGYFFDDAGTKKCAGYGVWSGNNLLFNVYGDDPNTAEKDGYDDDEDYFVKTWDAVAGAEYSTEITYSAGNDFWTDMGFSVIGTLLSPDTESFDIALTTGWNMISSYIEPSKPLMDSVFAAILDNILIVKNGDGKLFVPTYDINTIVNWNVQHGYQVYSTANQTLTITGERVAPENTPINTTTGWNMLSYLRGTALSTPIALASITANGKLLIAKNGKGKLFVPAYDINTIIEMQPGDGYQMYTLEPLILTYPE